MKEVSHLILICLVGDITFIALYRTASEPMISNVAFQQFPEGGVTVMDVVIATKQEKTVRTDASFIVVRVR